jgi:hypothetical protein
LLSFLEKRIGSDLFRDSVQAVFPGVTAAEMVDASPAGLDLGELIIVPSLPAIEDWNKFDSARLALGSNLFRQHAEDSYQIEK